MENEKSIRLTDPVYLTGIILILLSLFVYLISGNNSVATSSNYFGLFFINYGMTLFYFSMVLIKGFVGFKWPFFRTRITYVIPLCVLMTISAFALNREVCIFEKMADWVSVLLIIQCIMLLAFPFISEFPKFIRGIMSFCIAFILPLITYFAIYLMPFFLIGLVGSFIIGISLHVFVPLFMLITICVLMYRSIHNYKEMLVPAIAGMTIPLVILVVFVVKWTHKTNEINYLLNNSIMNESEIPNWIRISQHMDDDIMFEKILKTDLIYTIPSKHFEPFQTNLSQMNFENARQHDPLVLTACLFSTEPDLSLDEKIKILKSRYDVRHQAQERLWSGENLRTTNVISNVRIFPQNRLAYTEKTISIQNTSSPERFRSQEEAIYTFHLPEGSVVTSLSLWIDGVEEKGILTSKSKADTAYKTIVGREARDPSVIHWQEGNTVSARIFPCTPKENRRFKIGVTSPLQKIGNRLIYENIYFEGPPAIHCTESAQVQFDKPVQNSKIPAGFSGSEMRMSKQESYSPYWEIEFDALPLSTEAFSFDGRNYYVNEYTKQNEFFDPAAVYLDINSNWTESEFQEIRKALNGKNVFVMSDGPVAVNEQNNMQLFENYSNLNFSLFPFYKLDNSGVLVITKCNSISPQLDDLEKSVFGKKLKEYFSTDRNIRVYNLSEETCPYLKALKEVRAINYVNGSLTELLEKINKKEFIKSQENESTIVIDHSSIMIREDSTLQKGKGSDHLMRLFSYNHVMKQIGKDFFTPEKIGNGIIDEAVKAWIVSPVSSLIVLETQADYDRFGIEQSKNSLQNASIKGSGSVPEPHEIALAIFALLIVLVIYFNPIKN